MTTRSPLLVSDDPVLATFAGDVGDSGPIAIEGARTRWEVGGVVADDVRLVRAPDGIVEYKPEEMTIRVRAGTTVAELHETLREAGQRTGLPERGGTVGGALVVGENSVQALGRGRVREALLQVRYVSAEGRIINSGGPTVKNVSGFDLPRLMVGSLGTLGLVAEVILRTNPIPPVSRWYRCDGAPPRGVIEALLAPSAMLFDGASTWVELEGHQPDVDAEAKRLGAVGALTEVEGPPALPQHRWSLSPADVLAIDDALTGDYVAALGLGLVFASRPQATRSLPRAVTEIGERIKMNFDPTGRLNPGRNPERK